MLAAQLLDPLHIKEDPLHSFPSLAASVALQARATLSAGAWLWEERAPHRHVMCSTPAHYAPFPSLPAVCGDRSSVLLKDLLPIIFM